MAILICRQGNNIFSLIKKRKLFIFFAQIDKNYLSGKYGVNLLWKNLEERFQLTKACIQIWNQPLYIVEWKGEIRAGSILKYVSFIILFIVSHLLKEKTRLYNSTNVSQNIPIILASKQ